MLAHSFLIESSSKLLVTRKGIKARTSSISGLWFPWPIYMFFEMRFDLGTLDSGERSLFFGLLVIIIITTLQGKWEFGWLIFEPTHDKSDLIAVRWVILQTRMRSQQWRPDVCLFPWSCLSFPLLCEWTAKAPAILLRLVWAFTVRLCDKRLFHMSWSNNISVI